MSRKRRRNPFQWDEWKEHLNGPPIHTLGLRLAGGELQGNRIVINLSIKFEADPADRSSSVGVLLEVGTKG